MAEEDKSLIERLEEKEDFLLKNMRILEDSFIVPKTDDEFDILLTKFNECQRSSLGNVIDLKNINKQIIKANFMVTEEDFFV